MTFIKIMIWVSIWMVISYLDAANRTFLDKLRFQSRMSLANHWEQSIIRIPLFIP